jgi:AN1-type zinc finger and ubiquitin domain-containing protein 1
MTPERFGGGVGGTTAFATPQLPLRSSIGREGRNPPTVAAVGAAATVGTSPQRVRMVPRDLSPDFGAVDNDDRGGLVMTPPHPPRDHEHDCDHLDHHHRHDHRHASLGPAVADELRYLPALSGMSNTHARAPTLGHAPLASHLVGVHGGGRASGSSVKAGTATTGAAKARKRRCAQCNRRCKLATTFQCRCGKTFCGQHRYAEVHDCAFDYKSAGRKLLEASCPNIQTPKLPKI